MRYADLPPAKERRVQFESDREMRKISAYRWVVLIAVIAILMAAQYF